MNIVVVVLEIGYPFLRCVRFFCCIRFSFIELVSSGEGGGVYTVSLDRRAIYFMESIPFVVAAVS